MTLFVVATPIGNRADLSPRAVQVLQEADVIACEDTRVTRKLLEPLQIRTPTVSFHAHSRERDLERLLERLAQGERVALVSDAGTPTISDPGVELVQAARDAGHPIQVVPGPSALTAAVAASGLPPEPLLFLGFLPRSGKARRERIDWLRQLPATGVIYEAPARVPKTLAELAAALGSRPAVVARELTKLHETVVSGRLPELAETFAEAPRGEVVLVIGPAAAPERADDDEVRRRLSAELEEGDCGAPSDLARRVAAETGRSKSQVYRMLMELKGDRD